jgi:hypothetical protein
MFEHKKLWVKDIFFGLCKKDKKILLRYFEAPKIALFLHKSHRILFFREILCADIECPDVHPEFFFIFFGVFKYVFWAMGASTPMSQNRYP